MENNSEFKVICGNIGDSRAVLARLNPGISYNIPCFLANFEYLLLDETFSTITLSHDHKPTDQKERDRIVAAGGMVQIGRVDGQLALSRAFGDRALKVPMTGDRAARKVHRSLLFED